MTMTQVKVQAAMTAAAKEAAAGKLTVATWNKIKEAYGNTNVWEAGK